MNPVQVENIRKYLAILLSDIDFNESQVVQQLHNANFQNICNISRHIFNNPLALSRFIKNVQAYLDSEVELKTALESPDNTFITFLYNLFLSRSPETELAFNCYSQATIRQTIELFFQSLELRLKSAIGFGIQRFKPELNQETILIMGNCQALEIAKLLNIFQGKFNVHCLYVNQFSFDLFETDYLVDFLSRSYKFILTQELLNEVQFKNFSTQKLHSLVPDKVIIFPNIYFRGLHPDLVYFSGYVKQDYHSSIALKMHYEEITSEIVDFNKNCKSFAEYFCQIKKDAIFRDSFLELKMRNERWNIQIFDFFSDRLTISPLLLTINHPTRLLILEIVKRILAYLDINSEDICLPSSEFITTALDLGPVWPIYDEIRHYFGLRYEPMKVFYWGSNPLATMTIAEFIQASLDAYRKIDDEKFILSYKESRIANDFK